MSDDEKKIIIDEDWKAQVQREKEALRQQQAAGGEAGAAPASADADADAEAAPGEEGEKSRFLDFIGRLVAETMYALGALAAPGSKEVMVDLDYAAYNIESLEMLREKTKGNLTDQESGNLKSALAELQRLYAAVYQHVQELELRKAGIRNTNDLRGPGPGKP